MTAAAGRVRLDRAGAVAWLTLDRPPLNVLDVPLHRAITTAVREAASDASVAAIVVRGGGARAFSAGVEIADHVPETVGVMLGAFHGALRAIESADCVTVAAVQGIALGGGLELALACDLVVVERDARLGFPEIALGCYPPFAAARLPERIGRARAAELVLCGSEFTAEAAYGMGLANRVCEPGTLDRAVSELLAPLLTRSPAVLRETKRALREGAAGGDALGRIERRYLDELMKLEDAREGIAAFLDKRPPHWQGR